jgi:hypothetical protein
LEELKKVSDIREELIRQIELLANWNKEHVINNPEQCRKNLETMTSTAVNLRIIR